MGGHSYNVFPYDAPFLRYSTLKNPRKTFFAFKTGVFGFFENLKTLLIYNLGSGYTFVFIAHVEIPARNPRKCENYFAKSPRKTFSASKTGIFELFENLKPLFIYNLGSGYTFV